MLRQTEPKIFAPPPQASETQLGQVPFVTMVHRNVTEYKTPFAHSHDNDRAPRLSSSRTKVENWSITNSEADRVGAYYQPIATKWEEVTAVINWEI